MLKVNPTQNISLSAIGDRNCLSGYSVAVKDVATGLSGKYWIKTDKHTWQGGTYQMELELSLSSSWMRKILKQKRTVIRNDGPF